MSNKYIFAFDLDGTLLMSNGSVHPETLRAIEEASKQGHAMTIATGRSLKNTLSLLNKIPNISYLVCNNGALVYDVKNEKVISLYAVNPQHYIFVHEFAQKHGAIFKMHTDKDWIGYKQYSNENPSHLSDELHNQIIEHIQKNPNDKKLFNGQTITQLSIYKDGDFCLKHYDVFNNKLKDDSTIYIANSVYLDVNPKDRSKWEGLKDLAKDINIDLDSIVTFGDSGNDYEMIYGAGKNGYAMENSHPDLTEKIKPNIGNNDSNAIGAKILEYLK